MTDFQLLDDQGRATGLTNFLAAHRGYRRDAARFAVGLRALAAQGFPAAGLDALRHHWRGYDQLLLAHHQMEDGFLFPMMRQAHPELGAEIDKLGEQHVELDEHIADIDGWLAKLPESDAVEPAVAAFEALEIAVTEHLDLEEEHVVPLMLAHPPVPEDAAAGDGPPGPPDDEMDFAFVGPWLADGLPDDVVTALLAAAPPPFKLNIDENRRHYTEQLALWFPAGN